MDDGNQKKIKKKNKKNNANTPQKTVGRRIFTRSTTEKGKKNTAYMRIAIKFGPNTAPFERPVSDYVAAFLHECLGKDNKYHDAFSDYSVSQMRGGVVKDGALTFPSGGSFIVSSDNAEFTNDLINGIIERTGTGRLQTMPYKEFRFYYPSASPAYDIVRIQCLRLKEGRDHSVCTDEGYIDKLRDHTVRKLKACGIDANDAESIMIEPFHPEEWKVKYCKHVRDGRTSVTPSSCIMVVLRGSRAAREKIMSLGFGCSTGFGFGFAGLKCDKDGYQF